MYESPIKLNFSDSITNILDAEEKYIVECIQNMGVDIDKDELVKALAYDRGQYEKGYEDGKMAEKKIGHWNLVDYIYDRWQCSECGYGEWEDSLTPYCPNCGARMKGVSEDA